MKNGSTARKALSPTQRDALLATLQTRFEENPKRHKGLDWPTVQARLDASPDKFWSLNEMERTGGEPDVVGQDKKTGEILFYDCAPETPKGRRGCCYDRAGLESRKEHKPAANAVDLAADMGIDLLTEAEYRALQKLAPVDEKTSSWLNTPDEIRKHGGAIFGDYRYGQVWTYHNGAQSYYGARAFRGAVRV